MKKREHLRLFNFPDSQLATLTREKVAFIRRDSEAFLNYGLTEADFAALENAVNDFENLETDVEALYTQTQATADKDTKAEELRVAIRGVMTRVAFKYNQNSATYRKFGTKAFAQQADAELLLIAKQVALTAEGMPDLISLGVTAEMLANISTLKEEVEDLYIEMKMKIGDRDIKQENRTKAANAIYIDLIRYANAGRNIWETSDVAKYNDYIIYED